jgi:hypothetical protein
MSNSTTLEQVVETRRQEAVARYFEAVWRGAAAEEILDLATAAGRTPAEAQNDIDTAARAHELIDKAETLTPARQRLAAAVAEHGKLAQELAAVVAKLRPRVDAAAVAADDTRNEVRAAEEAATQLRSLWRAHQELVPAAALPAAVAELVNAEARDARRAELGRLRAAAFENLQAARRRVAEARAALNEPMQIGYEQRQRAHKRELAAAEEALRAAEARLVEADKALAEAGGGGDK